MEDDKSRGYVGENVMKKLVMILLFMVLLISYASATGFEEQDVWMYPIYQQTFFITDNSTGDPIPIVTLLDDYSQNFTTTNGTGYLDEPIGNVIVKFSSDGYYTRYVEFTITGVESHNVSLFRDVNSDILMNTYPKYVTFHLKEGLGTPVTEVNVTIQGVSTSTGNWDWIVTLLGIPLDEVAINGTSMSQTTDSLGRATFYVIPTAKYNVTFTKTGYTFTPWVLVPQDDDYIKFADGTASSFFRDDYDELEMINITVNTVKINETHHFINMSYNDTLAHTTGGFVNVTSKNATPWGADTVIASWAVTGNSCTNSTVVAHPTQVSGLVSANVTQTDFGYVERSYPYTFKGVAVKFLGFTDDIALLVALGIMMLTVMLAGAAHARHTVVAMAFEGWIFYAIDWFHSLSARLPNGDYAIIGALIIVTVLGFVSHVEVRKKKEKY